jgi:uncharacterized protein with HEPN domain
MYVQDMMECCARIEQYTDGVTRGQFGSHGMTYDATVRNIELLGEAARHVPEEFRVRAPRIPWREIIGTRNILVHGYFGIDDDILWDIVRNKVPQLKAALQELDRAQT